jgi:hypothetical protein
MNPMTAISETPAQAIVFLEELAKLVEKSPVTYSAGAAQDLAAHIRAMADAVNVDARVNPGVLETTRQYAALDWHSELKAVVFAKEHRPAL